MVFEDADHLLVGTPDHNPSPTLDGGAAFFMTLDPTSDRTVTNHANLSMSVPDSNPSNDVSLGVALIRGAAPAPGVAAMSISAGTVWIDGANLVSGEVYQVERRAESPTGEWHSVTGHVANGTTSSWSTPVSPAHDAAYYRLSGE